MITTLAIETSCDDTSLSVVSFDGKIFAVEKLLAYSQIDDHQKYGGVVPEFASRLHSEKIIAVLQNIGRDEIQKTDFISVTTHPGLPGSLVVGKAVAAFLAKHFDKPLVEVNHVYGHLFSLFLQRNVNDIQLPMVVLTASGGHNDIYLVEGGNVETLKSGNVDQENTDNSKFKIQNSKFSLNESKHDVSEHSFGGYTITRIGKTLDDAAGECFDKVSRMLGGPYPGGQWISEKAKNHELRMRNEELGITKMQLLNNEFPITNIQGIDIVFKRIFLSKDDYDFSFSGMKSQVSALLKRLDIRHKTGDIRNENNLPEDLVCDIAYEFQEAVIEVLVKKLIRAAIQYGAKTIGLAGGVSCNDRLWDSLQEYGKLKIENGKFLRPAKKVYSTDNGAMIGLAGILKFLHTEI